MGVNSSPKTVARQRRDCDLNPDRSAPESSTLTAGPLTGVKFTAPLLQCLGQLSLAPIRGR